MLGHTFVSGKPNVPDLTEVQGARDWDGAGYTSGSHGFTGGNVGAVLVRVANDADGSGGSSWVQSVATGSVFLSGGIAALPIWGKVDLTAHVTNTLPAANGGTGLAAYAVGDLLYASAVTPTLSRLAAVAAGQVLVSAGVNTPPAWSASPTLTSLLLGDGSLSAPSLTFTNFPTTGLYNAGQANIALASGGVVIAKFSANAVVGLSMLASLPVGWSTDPINVAPDTAMGRLSAGIVAIGNGTFGDFSGSLKLSTLTAVTALVVSAKAFSLLPSPVEGMLAAVADSTTAVWGAPITGGGMNHVLAYYDGTNWTVAAK